MDNFKDKSNTLEFESDEYKQVLTNHRWRALNNLLMWDLTTPPEELPREYDMAMVVHLTTIINNTTELLNKDNNDNR